MKQNYGECEMDNDSVMVGSFTTYIVDNPDDDNSDCDIGMEIMLELNFAGMKCVCERTS